jgi:GTPase SAR1 family protein
MVNEFSDKKTIIIGDVNTGKTALLLEILHAFSGEGEEPVTVIDMAPETMRGVGGKLQTEGLHNVRYMTTEIVPPRLTGDTPEEIEAYAKRNARSIDELFREYLKDPGGILFINDVSIYLQAGDPGEMKRLLDSTPTVVMNGYYGTTLGGGDFGERERRNMDALMERCDRVIRKGP